MEQLDISVNHSRCPYCHDVVAPTSEKTACDACMGWSHSECWTEHGACAACGHQEANSKVLVAPAPQQEAAPRQAPTPPRQGLAYGLGMVFGFAARHPRWTWITLTLILAVVLLLPRLRAMLQS